MRGELSNAADFLLDFFQHNQDRLIARDFIRDAFQRFPANQLHHVRTRRDAHKKAAVRDIVDYDEILNAKRHDLPTAPEGVRPAIRHDDLPACQGGEEETPLLVTLEAPAVSLLTRDAALGWVRFGALLDVLRDALVCASDYFGTGDAQQSRGNGQVAFDGDSNEVRHGLHLRLAPRPKSPCYAGGGSVSAMRFYGAGVASCNG